MSSEPVAAVIGVTGTVGRAIARALHGAGWRVVAVSRNETMLEEVAREIGEGIATVVGSVADDRSAEQAAAAVRAVAPVLNAVITSVNVPSQSLRVLDMPSEALVEVFRGNVVSHASAAKAFLPLLAPGGRYVGLGGGMADFTFPGVGGVSMCQAAQRNLFRFLALESEGSGRSVVELMLYSHIVDQAGEEAADARSIRADEVGAHVVAVLERPDDFKGPILALKSRKQVGQPEREP